MKNLSTALLIVVVILLSPMCFAEEPLIDVETALRVVNIRTGPGTSYPKLNIPNRTALCGQSQTYVGQILYIVEEHDGWWRIRPRVEEVSTPNSPCVDGWVHKDLVLSKKQQVTFKNKKASPLDLLYSTGLLVKFNIDFNKAYVNPYIWGGLDYDVKVNVAKTLAGICGQAWSTGRITIYNSKSGTKMAKYGSWGYKGY